MSIDFKINTEQRLGLARELIIGAPIAGLVWLLILRLFLGEWSFTFPVVIVCFSILLSLAMILRNPVGSVAFHLWKGLIRLIDWIVTRAACAFLFYLIFAPVGLMMRAFGKEFFMKRSDPKATSYWKKLSPRPKDRSQYLRQY